MLSFEEQLPKRLFNKNNCVTHEFFVWWKSQVWDEGLYGNFALLWSFLFHGHGGIPF